MSTSEASAANALDRVEVTVNDLSLGTFTLAPDGRFRWSYWSGRDDTCSNDSTGTYAVTEWTVPGKAATVTARLTRNEWSDGWSSTSGVDALNRTLTLQVRQKDDGAEWVVDKFQQVDA